MTQMKRSGDIADNDSLAREVAERAGASAIVGGNIVHASNGYTVNLTLRRASDGALLASFPETAASTKELIEVMDALTRKLRGKMGESLRAGEPQCAAGASHHRVVGGLASLLRRRSRQ